MEVRQVWQFGEDTGQKFMSRFLSDADEMEATGNRLMTFGGVAFVDGVSSLDRGRGITHARIIETTGDTSPLKVFELILYDASEVEGQIAIYRSERIPSLYPSEYTKVPNGVGDSLNIEKTMTSHSLSWAVPAADAAHTAADYYIVYGSTSPDSGFSIFEITAATVFESPAEEAPLVFYKLVSANTAGFSVDQPAP